MRISFLFLLFFLYLNVIAQHTFTIDNFSPEYYGKVHIDDTSEVFSPGWVAIYDRKANKELIRVVSEELALNLHDGEALANIKSLPYGEQSLIIYDDFNFDGKKDFAICDGQNSCYHGPSFKIFLATQSGFLYNKDFTRLAQDFCGMFEVESETKRISTMTKSGCCWHQFTEYTILNNKPKEVLKITEDYSFPFRTTTEERWNGKAMVNKTVKTLDETEVEVVFSFVAQKNGKKIVLYNLNDRMLYYALLAKDSTVEFSYPIDAVYQRPDFKFNDKDKNYSVSFTNKNATYTIYEQGNETGIIVVAEGKTYTWIGKQETKSGSLGKLKDLKLGNIE